MKLYFTTILILIFTAVAVAQQLSERDKAIELYQQQDFKAAVPILQNILTADKSDWNVCLYLGMSLAKIDKGKESMKVFEQCSNIYPKDAAKYNNDFKIITKPPALYTQEARENNISGTVVLAVEFRGDKKIGTIIPLKKLYGRLTEVAIDAAKEIKFNPESKDGKPITIIRIHQYSFTFY